MYSMKILPAISLFVIVLGVIFLWFSPSYGYDAPKLSVIDIDSQKHNTVNPEAPTLITFWATNCPQCIAEMPEMKKLHEQWQSKGFKILAVAMSYDSLGAVRTFQRNAQLSFPIVFDTNARISKAFDNVRLTPTHFLIDKNGKIIFQTIGDPNFNRLHGLIKQSFDAT